MNEMDQTIRSYGVRERCSAATDIDYCVEELQTRGYSVLPSSFKDDSTLTLLSVQIDAAYDRQCQILGGEDKLERINDANIARAPVVDHDIFIDIALDPKLQTLANVMLGANCILYTQNAIINPPDSQHFQFSWHRDLNYQHWTSSRCLGLSAMLCVDPFNLSTGGTYVLPATHKVEKFPSDRYVLNNQLCVHTEPGDWLLFDSMLFHRTGKNSSPNKRRGINHVIVPPFMAQQYDFMNMLGPRLTTEAARIFFGQGRSIAPSALEWRRRRME